MKVPKKPLSLKQHVRNFLIDWHQFPVDFWWRKRYNVPFGSKQHCEMSFIDMTIEYIEQLDFVKEINAERNDDDYEEKDDRVIKMTQEEIDKEYEDIDLSKFN